MGPLLQYEVVCERASQQRRSTRSMRAIHGEIAMSNWIHALPLVWMALVIFGLTFLVTAAIYAIVMKLATEDRAKAFKGVSAGLLSPLGVIFGLLVAFLAAQVWGDIDRGAAAVNHEASALRAVALLSRAFPEETQTRVRTLIDKHVDDVLNVE